MPARGAAGAVRRPRAAARTVSTNRCTSEAFHSLHAAGPVAIESAIVSACRRSSCSLVPTCSATIPAVAGSDEVAARRDGGDQQVQAHEVDEPVDVGGVERHPGRDGADEHDTRVGMVARGALADVVEQRPDEQQVGPGDVAGVVRRLYRAFDEMTIDGVAVERVALGPAPDGTPLRKDACRRGRSGRACRTRRRARHPIRGARSADRAARRSTSPRAPARRPRGARASTGRSAWRAPPPLPRPSATARGRARGRRPRAVSPHRRATRPPVRATRRLHPTGPVDPGAWS